MRRVHRHYKLTEEGMALMLDQAEKRMAVLDYTELAARVGLTSGSTKLLMRRLMHEKRNGSPVTHHGTNKREFHVEPSQPEKGPAW